MSTSIRAVLALVLVLLAATACSTTVSRADVAGREAADAAAHNAADAGASPGLAGTASPEGAVFGPPHPFPDGTVVSVSAPRDGGAVPARQAARTVIVTVSLRNGTPAPVSLSSLDVSGSADGADLTALDEAAQPDTDLEPGATAHFDLQFPLPPGRPSTFAVTTSMTSVDAAGNDIPGSDTAPGASVTFEAKV